jgi:putative DNA primase/helicase
MREDPWEFDPSHTIVLFSNHKPQVQGQDEGIWRRLRLVPWTVTIPKLERDEHLAEKLRDEGEGILAWIVGGARRYLTDAFDEPETVRAATADYRAEEDIVGRFAAECLRFGRGWAWSADIDAEAGRWANDQGVDPPTLKEIAVVLHREGCTTGRKKVGPRRGSYWSGVGLRTDDDEIES